MCALKHFNKKEYRRLGDALGDIQREFESLQVRDSSDIRWDISNSGISAHLVKSSSGATQPTDEAMDSTTFTVSKPHAPFNLSLSTDGTKVNVSYGFVSRNGAVEFVDYSSIEVSSITESGYIMLRAPFDEANGWGELTYVVIPLTHDPTGGNITEGGWSVEITNEDYPIGYVEVTGGTSQDGTEVNQVTGLESFNPTMAIFIKAGTCSE